MPTGKDYSHNFINFSWQVFKHPKLSSAHVTVAFNESGFLLGRGRPSLTLALARMSVTATEKQGHRQVFIPGLRTLFKTKQNSIGQTCYLSDTFKFWSPPQPWLGVSTCRRTQSLLRGHRSTTQRKDGGRS